MKKTLTTLLAIFLMTFSAQAKYELSKYDSEKILTKIFNKYDPSNDYSEHNLNKSVIKTFGIGIAYNEETIFRTTLLGIYPFEKNGQKKYFVVTQTNQETIDCHNCGALVGIAVFYKINEDWVEEEKLQYIDVLGSWGQAPQPELVKLGTIEYGLVFYTNFLNQGINSTSLTLVAKDGDKFKKVLNVETTAEDNLGGCGAGMVKCYAYETKVTYTVGAGEKFAPIILKTTGTKLNKKREPESFAETTKYVFYESKYVKIKGTQKSN